MKVIISKGPNFKEVEQKIYPYLNQILIKKGAIENVEQSKKTG